MFYTQNKFTSVLYACERKADADALAEDFDARRVTASWARKFAGDLWEVRLVGAGRSKEIFVWKN